MGKLQEGRAFLLQQRKWLEKRIEKSPPVIDLTTHLQTGGQVWLSSHPRTLNLIDLDKMVVSVMKFAMTRLL